MKNKLCNLLFRRFTSAAFRFTGTDMKWCSGDAEGNFMEIKKGVKVAFIGKPNTGKSTIINAMMGINICAASVKPQTTIRYQNVFHVEDDTHIAILDTPGVVSRRNAKKYNIKGNADVFTIKQLKNVDLLGIVVDASDKYAKGHLPTDVTRLILTLPVTINMILILNKVDLIKEKPLLLKYVDKMCSDMNKNLDGRSFSRIFMISALQNDGVDSLYDYIKSVADEKKKFPYETRLSSHPDHKIVEDRVRAALLEHLMHNIPYECTCTVEYMEENSSGKICIVVLIRCPTLYVKRKVDDSALLEKISFICSEDLKKVFKKPISLKIYVIFSDNRNPAKKRGTPGTKKHISKASS